MGRSHDTRSEDRRQQDVSRRDVHRPASPSAAPTRPSWAASRARAASASTPSRSATIAVFTSPLLNPENTLGDGTLNRGPAQLRIDLGANPVRGQSILVRRWVWVLGRQAVIYANDHGSYPETA